MTAFHAAPGATRGTCSSETCLLPRPESSSPQGRWTLRPGGGMQRGARRGQRQSTCFEERVLRVAPRWDGKHSEWGEPSFRSLQRRQGDRVPLASTPVPDGARAVSTTQREHARPRRRNATRRKTSAGVGGRNAARARAPRSRALRIGCPSPARTPRRNPSGHVRSARTRRTRTRIRRVG